MKNLLIAAVAAFAFVLASCDHSSDPGAANNTVNTASMPMSNSHQPTQFDYPLDFTLWNSCCNEYVHITGIEHFQYSYADGKYHVHLNTSQLSGTGTSGDTWHGMISENANENFDANGSTEYNIEERYNLHSSSGCSFTLIYRFHLTMDANGNLVVDRFDYSIECF
jgi:hypothetical protein